MNSLYNLAARQSAALRADIAAFRAEPSAAGARRSQISAALGALFKTIDDYESMARRELVVVKREKALMRATQLRTDAQQMRAELAAVPETAPGAAASAAGPGPAPMPRPRTVDGSSATTLTMDPSSASASAYAPYAPRPAPRGGMPTVPAYAYGAPPSMPAGATADPLAAYKAHAPSAPAPGDSPYSARETHALREHTFIQNTEAQLDAFIAQGRSVLGNLVEQRGILKETRKHLLDAANTMGLSRELIVCTPDVLIHADKTGLHRPHEFAGPHHLLRGRRGDSGDFLYVQATV